MTSPQHPVPPPMRGYTSWLDFVLDFCTMGYDEIARARAELAALRKELENTKAERDAAKTDLECLTISGDMLASDTSLFRGNSVRYWYDKARAYKHAFSERDAALKELSDTQGLLATARENLVAMDAQRAEAVRERDEAKKAFAHCTYQFLTSAPAEFAAIRQERDALRAQVAELREAVLGLGELGCAYADGNELYLTDWNAQVAKLRAEPAPKEEKQP